MPRPIKADQRLRPPKPGKVPACPKHITGAARAFWKRNTEMLWELGQLTYADLDAWEVCCLTYGAWRKAAEQVAAGEVVKIDRYGQEQISPWVRMEEKHRGGFMHWCRKFGLTPDDRKNLVAGGSSDEVDEMAL